MERETRLCPDCDDPLVFAFQETSGLGAWKLGDGFNTTPDTDHYICFACAKAWKQRLSGPLTQDVVGDLAFFSCRHTDCGRSLTRRGDALPPDDVVLACTAGHIYVVQGSTDGGLVLVNFELRT